MTTDKSSALHLRRRIGDVYLTEHPPPGLHRATWFTTALKREPERAEFHAMARDFLAVVDLYRRLAVARKAAVDAQTGLVIHGLLGHATAELMGSTHHPGWRAAALDLLDPDGRAEPRIEPADAARLLALALAPDADDAAAG